jgi:hypothetical protein
MFNDPQSIDSMLIDGAHAPTYPLIANQITEKFKIKKEQPSMWVRVLHLFQ